MRVRLAFLALLLVVPALFAQGPPKPEAQLAALAKLDSMVGTWNGEGWTDFGGRRTTFRGSEVVQRKLGGVALLVEGNFFSRPSGADKDIPVHTTLGVISFDPQTQKYRFTTWLATGTSGDRELIFIDGGWRWEIKAPRSLIRYDTKITESGEWIEIGQRSTDGGTEWTKFFEMKLKKE